MMKGHNICYQCNSHLFKGSIYLAQYRWLPVLKECPQLSPKVYVYSAKEINGCRPDSRVRDSERLLDKVNMRPDFESGERKMKIEIDTTEMSMHMYRHIIVYRTRILLVYNEVLLLSAYKKPNSFTAPPNQSKDSDCTLGLFCSIACFST